MASTTAEVTVTVKLFAMLRDLAPEGADPRGFPVALPAGATIHDLTERLQLPRTQWKVAFRNHVQCRDTETPLDDGDAVAFFPPIAGG